MKIDPACSHVREILVDLADGELESDLRSAAERHLAECPQCRALFGALRRSLKLVRNAWTQSARDLEKARRRPRVSLKLPYIVAGVAALLIFSVLQATVPRDRTTANPAIGDQEAAPASSESAQFAQAVWEAGMSEQMIRVAGLLEEVGARKQAAARLGFVSEYFSGTTAARQARLRLDQMQEVAQ